MTKKLLKKASVSLVKIPLEHGDEFLFFMPILMEETA